MTERSVRIAEHTLSLAVPDGERSAVSMPESAGSETRERILGCAEELFGQKGYDAVAVADIAQACGVSTALIYYHYTDKASLLRAIADRASSIFDVFTRTAVEGVGSPKDRIEAFIGEWVRAVGAHESLVRILVRPLTDPGGPLSAELLERISRTVEGLASVVAEGVACGQFAEVDPIEAAECLFALVNVRAAAGVLAAPGRGPLPADPERSAVLVRRLFLEGISA